MANPYYKKSHKCWYVNLNGKAVRLDKDEAVALSMFRDMCTQDYLVINIIQRFLNYHKSNSKDSTYKFYRRLESFNPGTLKISALKVHHITDWVENTKGNYRRNLMRTAKSCFKWAEDQGIIDKSPLGKMKLPPAISRGDESYLLPEQWNRIITVVNNNDIWEILTFLHDTGARPNEALTMEARHFDPRGRCIIFPKDESKGESESRVIHLNDVALNIVQRLAFKQPSGCLFNFTIKKLDRICERLSEKTSIKFTPYSLRHSFASEAIVKGVDLLTIATLMGHKDLKMLTKVYSHIKKRGEHIKQGLEKITA